MPNSGSLPSAGEGMWVEMIPVSFTSYAMDASCAVPQRSVRDVGQIGKDKLSINAGVQVERGICAQLSCVSDINCMCC